MCSFYYVFLMWYSFFVLYTRIKANGNINNLYMTCLRLDSFALVKYFWHIIDLKFHSWFHTIQHTLIYKKVRYDLCFYKVYNLDNVWEAHYQQRAFYTSRRKMYTFGVATAPQTKIIEPRSALSRNCQPCFENDKHPEAHYLRNSKMTLKF